MMLANGIPNPPDQLLFQWKEDAVKPSTLDLKKDKKICEDCALASEGCRTKLEPRVLIQDGSATRLP
jgi:hypothetical protein